MDKNKIELIILIILVTIGINYGIYNLYLQPCFNKVQAASAQYDSTQNRLAELKVKSAQLKQIQEENDKLKEMVNKLDELAPKDINTPQLTYDFYAACKKYGITGEAVDFQISDGKDANGNSEANSAGSNNGSGANSSGTANIAVSGAQKGAESRLAVLNVTLKISGEKNKVETFIRNLESISKRKLNVKSITLAAKGNGGSSQGNSALLKAADLSGQIVFNQYIQIDSTPEGIKRTYDFYNNKVGFNSISDIFGNYGQPSK